MNRAAAYRFGIGLVDMRLLGARSVEELRRRVPGFVWILLGSHGPSEGPEAARCLDAGAEDYVPAGLDDRILAAKLRGHLRRLLPSYASLIETVEDPGGTLRVRQADRGLEIMDERGIWRRQGVLTRTEARILCFFLARPDMLLERQAILEGVWLDRAGQVYHQTMDRHVESLRKKLGPHGDRIEAVYGAGYLFRGRLDGNDPRGR